MNETKICESGKADGAIKGFLNNALKEIMAAVDAECGSLFLFDFDHKELVLDSFYNSKKLTVHGLRKRMGEGVAGKVADIKAPVLVKDITQDLRFQRNGFTHYRTNSFISVPLFVSQGFLGLINVADKNSGEPFSEKDLVFASTIAKYACNAIEAMLKCADLKLEKDVLDEQKSQLEKYASVGKLAAGVVHEVNNPLDGVIRYTNMLLNQIDSGSVTHEYLSEIRKGLHRIANTTKSLLDFSQRVNSNYLHHKRYVDIHGVIEDSLDALRENISAGIVLERKFDSTIPKVMDLGLSHVVENIIKNSLDAMNGKGNLEISTDMEEKGVRIIFKDNGPGIPKDMLGRIFEPFFTTKGVGKGTGLGLAICSEIIQKYKGKIKVESTEGEGSTFIISIPRKYLENG